MPEGLEKAAVMYTDNREEAEKWADRLRETFGFEDVQFTHIGPVIGAHTGPGTIAVVAVPVQP